MEKEKGLEKDSKIARGRKVPVKLPRFDDEFIENLKANYGADLVEALMYRIEEVDIREVYDNSLKELITRKNEPSDFDAVAIERRKQEVGIIEQEVVIFREMGKLMTSINERYRVLTGLPPVSGENGGK